MGGRASSIVAHFWPSVKPGGLFVFWMRALAGRRART